ncbi:MAG: DinB family protein [Streptosporangiaceae bacterium]|nr:DinB family protein [Streptosporangiaceae bacterium]
MARIRGRPALSIRGALHRQGSATASFDLEMPGNAAAATRWLRASQEPLAAVLAALVDSDLDTPRKTNWGEWWPCHKIFTTLIREQVHHGAEISLLRDLYRNRGTLGSQALPRQ